MLVFGMGGHHLAARNKFGKYIGQILLVSDYNSQNYKPRFVLEPIGHIFKEIHAMKLIRELVDILNQTKPIKAWDVFKDDNVVFHIKISEMGRIYLFVSDKDYDAQIGYFPNVDGRDNELLAILIADMLNGNKDVSEKFEVTTNGDIKESRCTL